MTGCSDFFKNNLATIKDTDFTVTYSLDVTILTDKNVISFIPKIPVLADGCFLKLKSDNAQLQKTSDSTGYTTYVLAADATIKSDIAVIKLEYSFEKYLKLYNCVSDTKNFRQAGTFPLQYYTPSSSTYMLVVKVSDRKYNKMQNIDTFLEILL